MCTLALAVSACQSLPGARPDNRGAWLESGAATLDEGGEEISVFLKRADPVETATYFVLFDGAARPGTDYLVDGKESEDAVLRVSMAPGQAEHEIRLEAIDDIHAESGESIILSLALTENGESAHRLVLSIPFNDLTVISTEDSGEGTLRQAMLNANATEGPNEIGFDVEFGPFGPPAVIELASPLPDVVGELEIDGYVEGFLWKQAGTTISGKGACRLLTVDKEAKLVIRNLTLAEGEARNGGAILNRGVAVVSGLTFADNTARSSGGAIYNQGGELTVINSTFVRNRAAKGGAIANRKGRLVVTNSTLSENVAKRGGAVHNQGVLLLRNSILANSESAEDCLSTGAGEAGSTHNIVEVDSGCPGVLHEADPNLGRMDYFNGMTQTISLAGRSLAINSGDNESAVDENGEPLVWDQRGNGDPRFVAGITDIGAFEVQAFPKLVVDTLEDGGPQGCSGMRGDCPLRAAIRLADLDGKPYAVTFDSAVFSEPAEILLDKPLPAPESHVSVDASGVPVVRVRVRDGAPVFEQGIPNSIDLSGLIVE